MGIYFFVFLCFFFDYFPLQPSPSPEFISQTHPLSGYNTPISSKFDKYERAMILFKRAKGEFIGSQKKKKKHTNFSKFLITKTSEAGTKIYRISIYCVEFDEKLNCTE
jgi:hypothetical protein